MKPVKLDISSVAFDDDQWATGEHVTIPVPDGFTVYRDVAGAELIIAPKGVSHPQRLGDFDDVPYFLIEWAALPDRDRDCNLAVLPEFGLMGYLHSIGSPDQHEVVDFLDERYFHGPGCACMVGESTDMSMHAELKLVIGVAYGLALVKPRNFAGTDGPSRKALEYMAGHARSTRESSEPTLDAFEAMCAGSVTVEEFVRNVTWVGEMIEGASAVASQAFEKLAVRRISLSRSLRSSNPGEVLLASYAKEYVQVLRKRADVCLETQAGPYVEQVRGRSEFAELVLHYARLAVEAFEAQVRADTTEEERREMADAVYGLLVAYESQVALTMDTHRLAERFGNIRLPRGYWDLIARMDGACPGFAARKRKTLVDREEYEGRSAFFGLPCSAGTLPDDCAPVPLSADPKAVRAYRKWFEPVSWGSGEPRYEGYNGTFNGIALACLLSYGRLCVPEGAIHWDGSHHTISRIDVNASRADKIPRFVGRMSDAGFAQSLHACLDALERDAGLVVPRVLIHPGLYRAIGEGDLTGISLFCMLSEDRNFKLTEPKPNTYDVDHESRLRLGIPCFYELVARMICDMRMYNGIPGPFNVVFTPQHYDRATMLDAVDKPVAGCSKGSVKKLHITEMPNIVLPVVARAKGKAVQTEQNAMNKDSGKTAAPAAAPIRRRPFTSAAFDEIKGYISNANSMRIRTMLSEQVSAAYFVETDERIVREMMQSRDELARRVTGSLDTDLGGLLATTMVAMEFNGLFDVLLATYIDVIEAQRAFGTPCGELMKMHAEAGEIVGLGEVKIDVRDPEARRFLGVYQTEAAPNHESTVARWRRMSL